MVQRSRPRLYLERFVAGFAGADADGLFDVRDKNLAIADLVRAGGGDDRFNRSVHHILRFIGFFFKLGSQ